jgi:hypothetical protein
MGDKKSSGQTFFGKIGSRDRFRGPSTRPAGRWWGSTFWTWTMILQGEGHWQIFDSHYLPDFCVGSLSSQMLLVFSHLWGVESHSHHGFLLCLLLLLSQLRSIWQLRDCYFRLPVLLVSSPKMSLGCFVDSFIGVFD